VRLNKAPATVLVVNGCHGVLLPCM
jgi:hypothetical protein